MLNEQSNQIIQSLWVGDTLSTMEKMCINSYLHHGHSFHLYTYEDVKDIPAGTVILDANDVLPREKIYVDQFGGFVNLSNLFRYQLLYQKGGWWVDMDTICLKYFNFKESYVFSSEFSDPFNRYVVNTTFIKSPPGSDWAKECLDFLSQRGHNYIHWGELGVNLISRMIFRHSLETYIQPPVSFCPVSGHQLYNLISHPNFLITSQSYAIHWWHEIWKRRSLDKNASYVKDSLYERYKLQFLK